MNIAHILLNIADDDQCLFILLLCPPSSLFARRSKGAVNQANYVDNMSEDEKAIRKTKRASAARSNRQEKKKQKLAQSSTSSSSSSSSAALAPVIDFSTLSGVFHVDSSTSVAPSSLVGAAAVPPDIVPLTASPLHLSLTAQQSLAMQTAELSASIAQLSASLAVRDADIATRDADIVDLRAKNAASANINKKLKGTNEQQQTLIEKQKVETQRMEKEAQLAAVALTAVKQNAMRSQDLTATSAAAAALKTKANREKMMTMIQSLQHHIVPNDKGTQVLELLGTMKKHQIDNGVDFVNWAVTPDFVSKWEDVFAKVNVNVESLNQLIAAKTTRIKDYVDGYLDIESAVIIVEELNWWLHLLRDSIVTILNDSMTERFTIAHFLHTTNLAPLVETLMAAYTVQRAKKIDTNRILANFTQHRSMIHVCALHCHLRLLLWDTFHPLGGPCAATARATLVEFTTFVYRLIIDRDSEFDRPQNATARFHLNRNQLTLGRHWCIFASFLKADSALPSQHIETMGRRHLFSDTIVDSWLKHLQPALAEGHPHCFAITKLHPKLKSQAAPVQWCFRVMSIDELTELLAIIKVDSATTQHLIESVRNGRRKLLKSPFQITTDTRTNC